jgi:hypothetical protein
MEACGVYSIFTDVWYLGSSGISGGVMIQSHHPVFERVATATISTSLAFKASTALTGGGRVYIVAMLLGTALLAVFGEHIYGACARRYRW